MPVSGAETWISRFHLGSVLLCFFSRRESLGISALGFFIGHLPFLPPGIHVDALKGTVGY